MPMSSCTFKVPFPALMPVRKGVHASAHLPRLKFLRVDERSLAICGPRSWFSTLGSQFTCRFIHGDRKPS